jgi:hypothetical protein
MAREIWGGLADKQEWSGSNGCLLLEGYVGILHLLPKQVCTLSYFSLSP